MRIYQIILTEIASSKLKYEDELERVINDKEISINNKTIEIIKILEKLSTIEKMVEIWNGLLNNNNKND